jgi:hypothetical protein
VTTSGKDDDPGELDDPVMRSMRSVWISMRDEEPPAAGLAALLAAARVKAEDMRPREPWWRRVFAAIRRPPVLALATVVVLLGGAIAIGVRREAFEAMPKVETDRSRDPGVTAKLEQPAEPAQDKGELAPAQAGPDLAAETAAGAGAAAGPDRGDPEAGAGGPMTRGRRADVPRPQPPARPAAPAGAPGGTSRPPVVTATPPRTPAPDPVAGPGGADQDAVPDKRLARESVETEGTARPPSPPPAPPPQAPQTVKGGRPAANQGLQIAEDKSIAVDGQLSAPSAIDPAAGSSERIQGTSRRRGPTVSQLAKQSETAAARGDCAAVRAIVPRIRKLDAAFYKSHVEKNAAVKRCMK